MASKDLNKEEIDKRKNYLNDLKSQINEKSKNRLDLEKEKLKQREELEKMYNYNPFGKAGAGAPLKDEKGNAVVSRKHVIDEFSNIPTLPGMRPESGAIKNKPQKETMLYNFNFKNKKPENLEIKIGGAQQDNERRIIKDLDAKQADHQKRLLEQIEDNKRRREAEKAKKLELDRIEDEKLKIYFEKQKELREKEEEHRLRRVNKMNQKSLLGDYPIKQDTQDKKMHIPKTPIVEQTTQNLPPAQKEESNNINQINQNNNNPFNHIPSQILHPGLNNISYPQHFQGLPANQFSFNPFYNNQFSVPQGPMIPYNYHPNFIHPNQVMPQFPMNLPLQEDINFPNSENQNHNQPNHMQNFPIELENKGHHKEDEKEIKKEEEKRKETKNKNELYKFFSSQFVEIKSEFEKYNRDLEGCISRLKEDVREYNQIKEATENDLKIIRDHIENKKKLNVVYEYKLNDILEKHAPYNNIHLPISEVHPIYKNRSDYDPNEQLKTNSRMVQIPRENDLYDNLRLQKLNSLAKTGESLVSNSDFSSKLDFASSKNNFNKSSKGISRTSTPGNVIRTTTPSNYKRLFDQIEQMEKDDLNRKIGELNLISKKYDDFENAYK